MSAVVCNPQYEKYFQMWKEGRHSHAIREALGLDRGKFSLLQPEILHYCRVRAKEDFREGMAAGCYQHIVLTEDRRQQFLELVGSGLDFTQAALVMGIPIPTVMDVWFTDEIFKSMVESVRELQNAALVRALFKKALGRRYKARSNTRTTGTSTGKDEQGMAVQIPINTLSRTETEKEVEPDFPALKFLLTNRMPDQFREEGGVPMGNNRGKILEMVEAAVDAQAVEYRPEDEAPPVPPAQPGVRQPERITP